jgi:outer membrane biosynthesis protein TonB
MDRTEATGLGVAAVGHIALLAALSLAFAASRLPPRKQQPIEVSFVEEAAPASSAPEIAPTPPAPKLGEVEGPPAPTVAPPMPAPTQPQPLPPPLQPQPVHAASAPAPAAVAPKPAPAKPAAARPQPAPPKAAPARPTGRLSGLLTGLSQAPSASRSNAAPAATVSPAVRSSLIAEINRQLRPKWQQVVPSGADMDSLRTDLTLTLARDGSVTHVEVAGTRGVTPSNKPQVPLHQERARKAVMLASPFRLPAEFYDTWKQVTVTLDAKLSR